jgi:myo-inositol-1-phosphate synthase
MDDVVNRLARELSDTIAAAVAEDPRVEACRERARAAGFELKLSLEAVIGFVNRTPGAIAKLPAVQKAARTERRNFEISANDKRFLRSLRIAADETQEKEVE